MKYAILGYKTINIGDDIQSLVTSTLLNISYIVNRDDYDNIYNYNTGELITQLDEKIYLIMNGWYDRNGLFNGVDVGKLNCNFAYRRQFFNNFLCAEMIKF